MGTTYERVREVGERSVLVMKTRILYEYMHLVVIGKRFKDYRYLVVAK